MNSYNSSFSCGFLFDVKAEKANVWGPFIILIVVGWEQPHPNGVMLNLSLYLKSFAWRTFFFFFHVNNNNKKTVFSFLLLLLLFFFFYQMRISCTSLWLVERSLVFVSETFSIRFFMENRKPENVTWPRSCGRFCSSLFTFERKQGLPAVSDLQQGFLPLNIGQPCV